MFSSSRDSAFGPAASRVAAAASIAISAGGLVSISRRRCWALSRFFSQMAPPMPTVAAICASRIEKKNFQNRRPMAGRSVLDQLITHAVDGLQAGAAVGQGAQLVPQAGQVHVDIAVEARHRPAQALLGQHVLADRLAGIAGQDFQQVEFGAGQFQGGTGPAGAALLGPHGQLANDDGGRRQLVHRRALRPAQDGADARRHHGEDGDGVLARQRARRAGLAIVGGLDLEAFLLQVFLEHANQFDVVVYQQNLAHCSVWVSREAAIITQRPGAQRRALSIFTRFYSPSPVAFTRIYIALTALYTGRGKNGGSNR